MKNSPDLLSKKAREAMERNEIAGQMTVGEEKTYYLTGEKYTSAAYLDSPIARIAMGEEAKGYINEGIYKGKGFL